MKSRTLAILLIIAVFSRDAVVSKQRLRASVAATESAEIVEVEAAESTLEPSPTPETTPEPTAEPIAEDNISTGDATAEATVVNEANTNIVGEDNLLTVVNHTDSDEAETQPIDLSQYEIGCRDSGGVLLGDYLASEDIEITNNADITTGLLVSAETGSNETTGDEITTGDASSQANVFNMANTTLIGDCWYFGVFNIFDEYTGDIILPYEGYILSGQPQTSLNADLTKQISTSNSAQATENLEASADTGGNELTSGGTTTTGEADTEVQVIDKVNTTIYGSGWLLLEIVNPAFWQGTIEGGNTFQRQENGSLFYWLPMADQPPAASQSISITNNATINTNIAAHASTGGNTAHGADTAIVTGNAQSKINLANLINTTVAGSNWYYSVFNLFSNFNGDIVFPRADVSLLLKSDQRSASPGDTVLLTLQFSNHGRVTAKNNKINLMIPTGMTVLSSSLGSQAEIGVLTWEIAEIVPGETGYYQLLLQVDSKLTKPARFSVYGIITTETKENNSANNSSTIEYEIVLPGTVGGIASLQTEDQDPQILASVFDQGLNSYVEPEHKTRVIGQVLAAEYVNDFPDGQMCVDSKQYLCQVSSISSNSYAAPVSLWQRIFANLYEFLISSLTLLRHELNLASYNAEIDYS